MPTPNVCELTSRADRLDLAFPFHGPLEEGQGRGMDLAPSSLRPDRLPGHELRPGERRLWRLPGLVMVAVYSVHGDRDRRVAVTVGGYLPVTGDKLDRRPDAVVMTVAIAVDRDGIRLDLDGLPSVVHQLLLGLQRNLARQSSLHPFTPLFIDSIVVIFEGHYSYDKLTIHTYINVHLLRQVVFEKVLQVVHL